MRRFLIVLLSAGVAACHDTSQPLSIPADGEAQLATAARGPGGGFVASQIVARFQAGAAASAVAGAHGASVREALLLPHLFLLEVPAGREHAIAAALSRNPNVVYAEPNWILSTGPCVPPACAAINDVFWGRKWDLHNSGQITNADGGVLAATGAADADIDWWEAYHHLGADFAGSAVIAIIDTGIRNTHEDLAGKVIGNRNFYGIGNVKANDWSDRDGHGTHVAGIAAAHANNGRGVAGVGYGANIRLLNARVCGSMGCPTSAIANGIVWAADQQANVINLSLGGPSPQSAVRDALQYAAGKNVLAFCATGNDGREGISWPAGFEECVAVGATDWSDRLASYSNFGTGTELVAPGGDSNPAGTAFSYIASAGHSADNAYVYMAGTSMAAPQVAGLAALVYATGITSRSALRQHLRDNVDPLGEARFFGHGRINAYKAVRHAGGSPPPPPPPPPPGGDPEPLVASFTYSCGNTATCQFTDTSTPAGAIAAWSWSFGSAFQNPSHTFTAGSHPVTLTATHDDGRTAISQQATITCQTRGKALRCS
jgi:hypothetical protein